MLYVFSTLFNLYRGIKQGSITCDISFILIDVLKENLVFLVYESDF